MRLVVAGAGIVGLSCGYFLARDGHDVILVDPLPPGTGTSFGNAGILSFESCLPVGYPELLAKLPALLLRRDGPLRVRWTDLPFLAPWLLRFLLACRRRAADANAAAIVALVARAEAPHDTLIQECGLGELVRRTGWLKVARDPTRFPAMIEVERRTLDRFDLPYEILEDGALHEVEPALAPDVRRGLWLVRNRQVRSPIDYSRAILAAIERMGGRWLQSAVTGVVREGGRVRAVQTADRSIEVDGLVVAAGVFSRKLVRQLGHDVPLAAERGYHVMLPQSAPPLSHPVYGLEEGFVLAPMRDGIRLTSGVELARPESPPDHGWVRRLATAAPRLVRGLEPRPAGEWLGFRPSLPDSLPAIGRAPGVENAWLAFGHQHIGLTLGPLTGKIVADLVAGRDPELDLSPYRADRRFW